MKSKYCREYKGADKDLRYFLVLDREGYIPIRFKRKIKQMGLIRISNETICNCVTDYAVINKANGLYAAQRDSHFYLYGIGIKII